MKKIILITLLLATLLSLFVCAEEPLEFTVDAEYAAVYNIETKSMLFEKGANTIIYPASLAKIMTGILACDYYEEQGGDFDVVVSETALRGVQGNKIGLKAGERVSFYDLMCATLVGSGNDAAYVIAETVGGSVEGFVDLMNKKAGELGAVNTVYANPGGYHSPYMYTTLYDQALICAHASENERLLKITSLVSYEMPETNLSKKRTFTNQNLLFDQNHWLRHYTPNTAGLNVGMTEQAGWCLATVYDDDGLTNIVLVSGGSVKSFDYVYLSDAKALIEHTANSHAYTTVLNKGEAFHEAYVAIGRDRDSVILETEGEIVALLPTDINVETDITFEYKLLDDRFEAPVKVGDVFGIASAYYKGELVGKVNLVANTSVKRSLPLFLLDRISSFFRIPAVSTVLSFIFSLVFAFIVGVFIYVCIKRRRIRLEKKHSRVHARKNIKRF